MNIEIKHRSSGAALFSVDGGSLKMAVEIAVRRGADLRGAYLRGANLRDANLRDADLRDADLRDADLRGADLIDAHLGGAYLIDAGQDSRGYRFIGWLHKGEIRIRAGCRDFTLAEAQAHWSSRHSPCLRAECIGKLGLIESVAIARGWVKKQEAAA